MSEDNITSALVKLVTTEVMQGRVNYSNLIPALSLICLNNILSSYKPPSAIAGPAPTEAAPDASRGGLDLSSLLGQLAGGGLAGDGGGGDMQSMLSLLPLLNNPQLKSKITPQKLATIMSLMGSMNNGASSSTSAAAGAVKAEDPPEKEDPPQALATETETDKKDARQYLNWKI